MYRQEPQNKKYSSHLEKNMSIYIYNQVFIYIYKLDIYINLMYIHIYVYIYKLD